ncbi:unnamed protein product [Prorocentrum cordatum]|uniref:RNA helicase n=1 Tax=Prorocentrum cordatum TaxID=2364126 RepID=A0ABN9VAI5_9DINO|nr:unnamed protein product [Polarella glacialis]
MQKLPLGAKRNGVDSNGPAAKRARGGQGAEAGSATGRAAASAASDLPIHGYREEILEAVRQHRVVVLVGETGSGKTTQVPRFLHEAGYSRQGPIAVTQPRRIAAISVASRVAAEMQSAMGGLVGYHVRFLNRTSKDTRVKYMTDGMLVRESAGPLGLRHCGMVVLDEAHERSIHTDVLLGLVKSALDAGEPPHLRVIVMSATLHAAPFVDFFGGPKRVKLVTVPGRQHPVQLFYTPTPEPDFLEARRLSPHPLFCLKIAPLHGIALAPLEALSILDPGVVQCIVFQPSEPENYPPYRAGAGPTGVQTWYHAWGAVFVPFQPIWRLSLFGHRVNLCASAQDVDWAQSLQVIVLPLLPRLLLLLSIRLPASHSLSWMKEEDEDFAAQHHECARAPARAPAE